MKSAAKMIIPLQTTEKVKVCLCVFVFSRGVFKGVLCVDVEACLTVIFSTETNCEGMTHQRSKFA